MKEDIIHLRKEIYKNLKERALSYELGDNQQLEFYRNSQENLANQEFFQSSIEEVLTKAKQSQLIYLGDFHTFDQNIRNVLRIIKAIIEQEQDCIICLEMVQAQYQYYLDSFMQGHLTELEFLEMIKYHESWRFPWSHYKLIFDLAKKHKVKIVGINNQGSLEQRDLFAANLIANYSKDNSHSKLIVFYGEYHIVSDKIPHQVKVKLPNIKDLIIHQNLDGVYWKQIELGQKSNFVKFSENEICINTAPPWVKYESMIYWYENLCDDPEFDIHEYIIENGTKIFTSDAQENFELICNQMTQALKINIDVDTLSDFNLYDHTSLEYILELIDELDGEKAKNLCKYFIANGESFRIPSKSTFYCSNYSLNRIAYLAGIHIFYSSLLEINPEKIIEKNDSMQILCFYTQQYLFAYFFSKVINPHRKCDMFVDLTQKNSLLDDQIKDGITSFFEHRVKSVMTQFDITQLLQISRFSGHILGEYLYQIVTDVKQHIDINDYLLHLDTDLKSFSHLMEILLKSSDYKNDKKMYF